MMSLEDIRKKLNAENMSKIARQVGLTSAYLSAIRRGIKTNPSYDVVRKLSLYFESPTTDGDSYIKQRIEGSVSKETLAKCEKLSSLKCKKIENTNSNSIVYALVKDEKIIYVGSSICGLTRPFSHSVRTKESKPKDFDYVYFVEVDKDDVINAESYLILNIKPKLNKKNKNGEYIINTSLITEQ